MAKDVMLVTGAGQISMALARRVGFGKKIVLGDKNPKNCETVAKIMNDAGYDVEPFIMDLSSRESILAMIKKGQEFGEIKYLINGAGVSPSQAPIEAILKVDLYGTAVLLEEVVESNRRELEMSIRLGIPYAEPIFASVLEITSITQLENASFGYIPVICGICSFGGLCVLLQIIVVVKDRFSLKPFLLTRPAGAMLSMLNSLWLCRLLLPSDIQASSNHQQIFVKVNNFVPSVCLILMIFLLKIKKGVAFSKRM